MDDHVDVVRNDPAGFGIARDTVGLRKRLRERLQVRGRGAGRDHKEIGETGLAADINSLETSWGKTPEGKWLAANCYKYGFIIRYPAGKEDKTGYQYEPWHVRYLGVETATAVYKSGLCLEEYLGITSRYAD